MITEITATMVSDDWAACYAKGRVAELFPVPRTPLEVLTLKEGPWADVPPKDRLWVATQEGVLPDKTLRLFACWCAEQVLHMYEEKYPGDSRPRNAIEVARRFAVGDATEEDRDAAWAAARAAAGAAAGAAARAAAGAAAGAAAWAAVGDAVWDAASAAAWAAAWDAVGDAVWDAAWAAQIQKLAEMVDEAARNEGDQQCLKSNSTTSFSAS